jgi:uncharacterized protein involved in oxidation of intracellular sulfur
MSVTLVVNSSPYGTEEPYNALRLAQAIQLGGEWVELFFMGDGVHTARRGQDPRGSHASLEALLTELLEKGVVVTVCGTCCRTRGVLATDLVEGCVSGTIHDLAALVQSSGKVVSF